MFGDHVMVEFCINCPKVNVISIKRRGWRNYSKESLIAKLKAVDWNIMAVGKFMQRVYSFLFFSH